MFGTTGTETERRPAPFHTPHRTPAEIAQCQLQDLVDTALQRERPGLLSSVRAHVNDGQVQLTGHVPTYYAKQLAQNTAMSVPGVLQLRNDLDVL